MPVGQIVLTRAPGGRVHVDVGGLLAGPERRAACWRSAFAWLLIGVVLAGSATVAGLSLRWDRSWRWQVRLLEADLLEVKARARCWELVALRLDPVPSPQRPAWVRRCLVEALRG